MIAMTEQAVWTVNKILQWTQQYFSGKGLETPRLDAEVLLCDVLGCRRIDLFMRLQQELSPEELKKYRSFVLRRAAWEPLAYITGHKTFLQWEFNVTPAVLIPRPETELLVEKAVHFVTGKSLTQLEKEAFWRKKAEEAKAAADKVKTLSAEKLQDETDPEKAIAWQQEVAQIDLLICEHQTVINQLRQRKRELTAQHQKRRKPSWDNETPLYKLVNLQQFAYYQLMIAEWQKRTTDNLNPRKTTFFLFPPHLKYYVFRALATALAQTPPVFNVYLAEHSNLGTTESIKKALQRLKNVGT